MRDLIYICVQPNQLYYTFQVNVWLESAKRYNIEDKCHILIYNQDEKIPFLDEWNIIQNIYPKAKFFFYQDNGISNLLNLYIPLLRPHTLFQHFTAYPELKDKAIFYHDCDIILNRALNLNQYLDDDINYVSNTIYPSDYMSHKYFEAKRKDILPEGYKNMSLEEQAPLDRKLEEYDKRDILEETGKICGVSKDTIVNNYENTGGAQYLLKNIDATFWDYVQSHSLEIRIYLQSVNRKFFISEERGFQSWCADMWAVLWGLWAKGAQTRVIDELSFCWSTETKDNLSIKPILHNAGVTSEGVIRTIIPNPDGEGKIMINAPAFYKGRYHNSLRTPFNDDNYINNILHHPISSQYCFHTYLQEIVNIKQKYQLNY